jgi:hypothetical protein
MIARRLTIHDDLIPRLGNDRPIQQPNRVMIKKFGLVAKKKFLILLISNLEILS